MNEGVIKWSIPLGEVPELAAKGIVNTGTHYPKVGANRLVATASLASSFRVTRAVIQERRLAALRRDGYTSGWIASC